MKKLFISLAVTLSLIAFACPKLKPKDITMEYIKEFMELKHTGPQFKTYKNHFFVCYVFNDGSFNCEYRLDVSNEDAEFYHSCD